MIRQLNHILAREKVADLARSAEKARLAHEHSAASNAEANALNKSEQAIHEIQQCHLHDVWDKNITPTCEGQRIGHDTGQRGLHPLTSRPHRIVHEIPRKHTINGYAYDV